MKISTKHIDYVNIGIILISLLIAFVFPFRLFLLSYAILGPLHYLTEINWLDGKKYFTGKGWVIWVFAGAALLFSIPHLLRLSFLENCQQNEFYLQILAFFQKNINSLILFSLAFSIAMLMDTRAIFRTLIIAGGIVLAVLLKPIYTYNLWIGLFIPTLIHVFVFTILFMIYGAIKDKSVPGFIAAAMAISVPIVIVFIDINPSVYSFSENLKATFFGTNFHIVNAKLAEVLRISDGNQFYFYEKIFLKIQIFIAFAYTYHFLNWYSKTSIIGWAKNITTKKFIIIGILWIISMGLYWYDYKTGFLLLALLSVLHVFVEFPLNILSISGISSSLFKTVSKKS